MSERDFTITPEQRTHLNKLIETVISLSDQDAYSRGQRFVRGERSFSRTPEVLAAERVLAAYLDTLTEKS